MLSLDDARELSTRLHWKYSIYLAHDLCWSLNFCLDGGGIIYLSNILDILTHYTTYYYQCCSPSSHFLSQRFSRKDSEITCNVPEHIKPFGDSPTGRSTHSQVLQNCWLSALLFHRTRSKMVKQTEFCRAQSMITGCASWRTRWKSAMFYRTRSEPVKHMEFYRTQSMTAECAFWGTCWISSTFHRARSELVKQFEFCRTRSMITECVLRNALEQFHVLQNALGVGQAHRVL